MSRALIHIKIVLYVQGRVAPWEVRWPSLAMCVGGVLRDKRRAPRLRIERDDDAKSEGGGSRKAV